MYGPCLTDTVHLLISTLQCDIATLLLLLSAWIRYAGTAQTLSKGGAYTLIIIGQVGKTTLKSFPRRLILSSGTFCSFPTSIPDFSTEIFRTVV